MLAELRRTVGQLSLFQLPPPDVVTPVRHIVLGGQAIGYLLQTGGNRRRLSLRVDDRGLRVGAPRGTRIGEIEEFIRQHADWVREKLSKLATSAPRHVVLRDGARLPLFGAECQVRVTPGSNRVRWIADTLLIEARPGADLNQLAQRALQRRALVHFGARLQHFAPLLGVAPPTLALSSARTRWGSCSRVSGVRINWRLIHLPPELGDYVVVHELAHLHEMNHGQRFWAWVEKACPDWRSARAALRQATSRIPLF